MQRLILIGVFNIMLYGCNTNKADTTEKKLKNENFDTIIAFGSCAHEYEPLPVFNAIVKHNPDIFIWLGDIVYGDTHDMAVLKEKYDTQKAKPAYQKLLSNVRVIGVWDDHDYGVNDGGKNYPMKNESKELLLDFLDVSADDPVRERQGVYSSHEIESNGKIIKIILLDTRYFRDTLLPAEDRRARYKMNETGDILGEAQWSWLENVLRTSSADFTIIGSGIQVISEEQGYEKWANFPSAHRRLFNLIANIKPGPVMLISGDRHIAEISMIEIEGYDHPLYDFTSSGLTHSWAQATQEPNRHRVGDLITKKNFGLIKFRWDKGSPTVVFEIRGVEDEQFQKLEVSY